MSNVIETMSSEHKRAPRKLKDELSCRMSSQFPFYCFFLSFFSLYVTSAVDADAGAITRSMRFEVGERGKSLLENLLENYI